MALSPPSPSLFCCYCLVFLMGKGSALRAMLSNLDFWLNFMIFLCSVLMKSSSSFLAKGSDDR